MFQFLEIVNTSSFKSSNQLFKSIRYSDLLGKKEENTKKAKTNKFMDLLLNEELTIKTNSNSVGLRDQKKSNTTTNKFMKELHFFS